MSKRMKEAQKKLEEGKLYALPEAVALIQDTAKVKFDPSLEVHINLGIDPKKSDQMVRSVVSLPHGSGKTLRIAAFVSDADVAKAKEAGADIAGSGELIDEIKSSNKCDFDIAVATPDMMKKLAVIARVLGQKGLMPNPKTGTIAPDVTKLIQDLKKGKIAFKSDAGGTIHAACGKVSFDKNNLVANIEALLEAVMKAKPQSLKGNLIKSVYLSSSMGPSVRVTA